MKHAINILNAIKDGTLLLFCFDCKARREAAEAGLLDFSGQGRDKYGK